MKLDKPRLLGYNSGVVILQGLFIMIYLQYLPEFDNYGIKKLDIEHSDETPEIKLRSKDAKTLGMAQTPKVTVGFLMGQDKSSDGTEYYTVDTDYLKAVLRSGADIKFLDYDNTKKQLKG